MPFYRSFPENLSRSFEGKKLTENESTTIDVFQTFTTKYPDLFSELVLNAAEWRMQKKIILAVNR